MWKKVKFNRQNIKTETNRAVLIKLPKKSSLSGWCLWHPAKLIKEMEQGKGYWLTMSYTDDWDFKLLRDNKKDKTEKKVSVSEIELAFEKVEDHYDFWESSYLHVYEPEKINDEVEVDESLKR